MEFEFDTSERCNYIYLIHLEKFEKLNLPIYKFGKTYRLNNRFKEYPRNGVIYYVCRVKDCLYVEDEIKKAFIKYFVHKKEYGYEYFEGQLSKMIKCIDALIDHLDQRVDDNNLVGKMKKYYSKFHRIKIGEINDILTIQNVF